MALTIEELKRKLQYRIATKREEFATKSLHLLERPLAPGTMLHIGPHKYEVPKGAFLVIIDEAPGAFWTHPVHYELHDTASGEVHVLQEQYPLELPDVKAELVAVHIPDLAWLKKEDDKDFREAGPINLAEIEKQLAKVSFGVPLAQSQTRHALFFAGMDNMPHFHTDFVIMRQILIDRYGYDPANILISMGDATGYPDLPVDYAGDQAGLDAALDAFGVGGTHALGAGDTLFLYTFNHGGADAAGAYLCLPGWGEYYDFQLRAKLDNIQCGQMIVAMNQCHSGGFISEVTGTTGPAQVAIMTACREDQSAYPSAGVGDHGYFSVALAAALNWAFPASVSPTFPGHVAGEITTQDSNNDGLVSAEEAWHYVQDMMTAHHNPTITGIETPRWGVSAAGVGASLYWGLPDIRVEDGIPMWESPDVFLHDPTVVPDDATAAAGNPANWGDYYHPDVVNRVVARVHNSGCAPARNVAVEFRAMSFGAGGGINLIGTYPIVNIDPGEHAYAYIDWNFSSDLIHRCVMVRANCAGDPATPFGTPIGADDNQAQRNLDPLFAGFGEAVPAARVIERTFLIQNTALREATFAILLGKSQVKSDLIRPVLPPKEQLRKITLRPGEQKELKIRFEVSPKAKKGEKLHLPLEIRRLAPGRGTVGGVTFTVEIAEGQLEGRVVNLGGIVPKEGTVTIENTKQTNLRYSAKIGRMGRFSFRQIVPGPYKISADCGKLRGHGAAFVEPNRITTKVITIVSRRIVVREPAREAKRVELAREAVPA